MRLDCAKDSEYLKAVINTHCAPNPPAATLLEILCATQTCWRGSILFNEPQIMRRYGRLRAAIESEGRPIGNLDMMIAAHALTLGAVLVTHDRAFARITGLKTEDWTTP